MKYYRNIEIVEVSFIGNRKLYKVIIAGNCVLIDKKTMDRLCDFIDTIEKGESDAGD